jgi:MSHA biogenesis protein MshL
MNRSKFKTILLAGLIASLTTACSVNPGNPAINQINKTVADGIAKNQSIADANNTVVPNNINKALLPSLSLPSPEPATITEPQRFDVTVNNVPAQVFFAQLVAGTPYNMMVSPDITGNITLNLKQVTIDQVLSAVHDLYGYQYKITPYGYQVFPFGIESRIFHINYLDVGRNGATHVTVGSNNLLGASSSGSSSSSSSGSGTGASSSSGNATTTSIATSTKNDVWKKLSDTLNAIVGNADGRQVVINSDAGLIYVKADPKQMRVVEQYLDTLQAAVVRQVIIDARVLEVTLNTGYQTGINWDLLVGNFNFLQRGNNISSNILSTMDPMSMNNFSSESFTAAINLLSTQGNVQVLSSPRISTLNNQPAIIKVGDDEFFVTDVSSTSTPSSAGTSSQTAEITLTPFFSGIALSVTPEISSNDSIILHIHPIVSTVKSQTKTFTVNGQAQSLPLALSSSRETDSMVYAKSGQVVIIGGLMQEKTDEQTAGTPYLEKIPYAGNVFRDTDQFSRKSELIILLSATIVDNHTWTKKLQEEQKRYQDLNQGYHFGNNPEIFGTTGENQ